MANQGKTPQNLSLAGVVDANSIAIEELGIQAPNTCVLGAFAATTKLVRLNSIILSLRDDFKGKQLDANIRCVKRSFKESEAVKF